MRSARCAIFSSRGGWHLDPRPLGENVKKTSDVFGNLTGALAAQLTAQPWLPNGDGTMDDVVVRCSWWFHLRFQGRINSAPCSWSGFGITATALDLTFIWMSGARRGEPSFTFGRFPRFNSAFP